MILPPKELKYFSYYKTNYKDDYYDPEDEIIIWYRFWFFTCIKKLLFKRKLYIKENKKYGKMSQGYIELIEQLDGIIRNKWNYLSNQQFELVKEKYPEWFI